MLGKFNLLPFNRGSLDNNINIEFNNNSQCIINSIIKLKNINTNFNTNSILTIQINKLHDIQLSFEGESYAVINPIKQTLFTLIIESISEFEGSVKGDFAVFNNESYFELTPTIIKKSPSISFISESELNVNTIKILNTILTFDNESELILNLSKSKTFVFEYNGILTPGDTIVINMEKMTVEKNGNNVLHEVETDFFPLYPGTNNIIYRDGGNTRNLNFKIEYRNRWL